MDDDAPFEEIKRAYRSTCKECHPDFMGDAGHNICILLNEAYEVSAVLRVFRCWHAHICTVKRLAL